MGYGKHKVEHIINKTPSLSTDTNGNTVLVGGDGRIINLAKNSSSKFRPSNGGGLVVSACSTTTGYTTSRASGTVTLTAETVPAGGPSSRKGSTNLLRLSNDTVGSWTALETAVTATPNPSKRTDFWFYIPDYTKISTLTLYLSVAADYLNYYSVTVTPLTKNGWQVFTISDTEWVVTGSPTFDTITKIKFRATPVAGQAVDIYWDRAVYSPSGIPQVCLMWDDGTDTDYTRVAPLLAKYGLKGTFSIITDLIGTTGFMTWDQVHALEEAGHEIVVHGQYGLSSLANLAAATADIEHNRDALVAQGFTEATDIYVFPQGIYQMSTGDDSLVNYLAANNWRGAFLAQATSYIQGDIDPVKYVIGRAKIESTTVAATWLAMLDVAAAARRSFVSVSHEVVASGATTTQTNYTVLEDILSGIATRQDAGSLISVKASQCLENLGL